MFKRKQIVTFLIASGIIISCTSAIKSPNWVTQGSGAFPGEPTNLIYGVGVAGPDPNPAIEMEQARARARAELAASIQTTVQRLVKDFMQSHKDWFDLKDTAGSDELFTYVSKQVVDVTLMDSRQVDSWKNPKTGDLYMLYKVDINSNMWDTYKNALRRALVDKHYAVVKAREHEAEKDLDKAVQEQRAREDQIIGVSPTTTTQQ